MGDTSSTVQNVPFQSTGPQGHRGRMRDRLLVRGPEGLADYEVLEMLLFLGIPRGDTKPLAKGLINAFGSLGRVLAATPEELVTQGAMPEDAILPLRLVQAAAHRLARADAIERPLLNSLQLVETWLRESPAAPTPPASCSSTTATACWARSPRRTRRSCRSAPCCAAPCRSTRPRCWSPTSRTPRPAKPGAAAAHRLAQAASLVSITVHDRLVLRRDGLSSYRAAGLFKPVAATR